MGSGATMGSTGYHAELVGLGPFIRSTSPGGSTALSSSFAMLAQGEWCGRLALSLPTCREHHHGPAAHEYPHPRWMARDTRYRTNQEALGQVVGLASTRGFAQRV